MKVTGRSLAWLVAAAVLCAPPARAQTPATTAAPSTASRTEAEKDALGRDTPRGTLVGFMTSARRGNLDAAALYLDAPPQAPSATDLARKLYVVLDTRLPARINELSDRPEGSLVNPLKPDQEVIGAISTDDGPLDLVLERVNRGAGGSVWLFSRRTLAAIPAVYNEVDLVAAESYLPRALTGPKVAGIRLFQWLAFFVAIPILYRLIGLIGLLGSPLQRAWRRRHGLPPRPSAMLPGPFRLVLLAVAIRWSASNLDLPLFERQFWSMIARLCASTGVVWLGLLLSAFGEQYFHRRLIGSAGFGNVTAMLRLLRRTADVLVVLIGVLMVLQYFSIDPTAALAGLGIGGIAVALSAQKTLENVIGGLSIIFDKAVRVGDFVNVGGTSGTVDYIGLRSTRIRTVDRTMLSVPNGQIANINIETVSARDKFKFNHFVGLGYQTTAAQMRTIVAEIRQLLLRHSLADDSSIRARFVRMGPSSIDVEIFTYIFARDWPHFLEVQEELLLAVMEIVERAGATIAYPSQTLYFADGGDQGSAFRRMAAVREAPQQASHVEAV